ncbi:dynein regulatory complex protein 10-like [Macrobrachium rosenbergii]|uniref:dynein regulatory complex protein 10-like n=1 Tax=Macrobrachium rosenbergii TaxID=79674 RepID=UPI0034D597BD
MKGTKNSSQTKDGEDEAANIGFIVSKKRSAVVQAVAYLEKEAWQVLTGLPRCFPSRAFSVAEDQSKCRLLEVLKELRPTVRNQLYFSAKLEYVYASQIAKYTARATNSGESLGRTERQLTEALNQREECLGARDDIIASLTSELLLLRQVGSQSVLASRAAGDSEFKEVRASSENNLDSLKASLSETEQTMRSHELRDEQEELELRKCRQDIESEIMRKICHYDATMSALQNTLDALREEDQRLTALLKNKKVEFIALERRFQEIEDEKRRIEEARMAAMQAEFRREYAARTIQRAWQHYKMRKMLKKAQRKKKKKPKDK